MKNKNGTLRAKELLAKPIIKPSYIIKSLGTRGRIVWHVLIGELNSMDKGQINNLVEDIILCTKVVFLGCPIPHGVWRLQMDLF